MPKNIIICCDGTGNQFGRKNSNIVKLYDVIKKIPQEQIAYYDPGVGTNKSPGIGLKIKNSVRQVFGLMTGYGIYQNVYEAYFYLMERYEPGDRVFLFGFSRGAYTVRVLSGFIYLMGLLEKGCQNLIPYAFDLYSQKKVDFATTGRFKSQFSRHCPISFMGIWDTVSSVGYLGNWRTFPHTANNENVKTIRHALAIDEKRAFFGHNKLGKEQTDDQSIREVWFAGVHSDIGGSYDELESGLSKITLQWMLNEAIKADLLIDSDQYEKRVLRTNNKTVGPNPLADKHKSLKGFWLLGEILPKYSTYYDDDGEKRTKWYIPFGKRRNIPEGATIHRTVIQKIEGSDYQPPNMPSKFQVEEIEENIFSGA